MTGVLQAKDVAKLVGLTEDGVKQWTIGRPYSIHPSIRSSTGKGIPNLYSFEDALRFNVAVELTADGFQSFVIQRVLDSFDPTAQALFVYRTLGSKEPRVEFSSEDLRKTLRGFAKFLSANIQTKQKTLGKFSLDFAPRSFYVMDVELLRTALAERWERKMEKIRQ